MRPHRSAAFLRSYGVLPHGLLDRTVGFAMRRQSPRTAVDAVIRYWIRRGGIDMADFEPGPFATVEDFFLRRLRANARPLAPGFVSPVDGVHVGSGPIHRGELLVVKDHPVSVGALLRDPELATRLEGGTHTTIFLTPDGYHRVHLPIAATLESVRPIAGRAFPQNDDALRHVRRIYERNARTVLTLALDDGTPLVAVMVGASLISGIHVTAPQGQRLDRGAEVGHFSFGSTIVLLAPAGQVSAVHPAPGEPVRFGQALWELTAAS